mmetsp:Transcript_119009/g.379540  ORF Transcript_119009/g.379540 Transcript_119009/m.379540 type:complete len:213 (-) Transcript_119009:646-1284(-)
MQTSFEFPPPRYRSHFQRQLTLLLYITRQRLRQLDDFPLDGPSPQPALAPCIVLDGPEAVLADVAQAEVRAHLARGARLRGAAVRDLLASGAHAAKQLPVRRHIPAVVLAPRGCPQLVLQMHHLVVLRLSLIAHGAEEALALLADLAVPHEEGVRGESDHDAVPGLLAQAPQEIRQKAPLHDLQELRPIGLRLWQQVHPLVVHVESARCNLR